MDGYSLEMSSLVVFSIDVPRLARFYEIVLGLEPLSESSGDIRLTNERDEVLVH
jgi:catechol-2,3-dioxygenase